MQCRCRFYRGYGRSEPPAGTRTGCIAGAAPRTGPRWRHGSCTQIVRHLDLSFPDFSPDLLLVLIRHRFLTYAWLRHYRCMCIELERRFNPAVRLHAKNAKVYGIAFCRNDAVFADHSILLPASHNFARQQDQRAFRVVHQDQVVDTCPAAKTIWQRMTANHSVQVAHFRYYYFTRTNTLIECQKLAGVVGSRGNHGENREVSVGNRVQEFVVAGDQLRVATGAARRRWRYQHSCQRKENDEGPKN